jgi:hypothetical protein
MAKTKQDKKLYSKMRDNGIRKRVAKDLSKLPSHVSGGKQAPKPLRDAIERLEGLVKELRGHADSGERQTAARKAARTRKQNAASRSASARKAARTRARSGTSSGSGTRSGSAKRASTSAAKSRSGAAASKSRTGASTAKSRSGAAASKPRARRSTAKRTGSGGSS